MGAVIEKSGTVMGALRYPTKSFTSNLKLSIMKKIIIKAIDV